MELPEPVYYTAINGFPPLNKAGVFMFFFDMNNKDIDDELRQLVASFDSAFAKTHDYRCGVCKDVMHKQMWNAGPKTHEYWYCRTCKKEEDEMRIRGSWVARDKKEDKDESADKYRTKGAGFFRDTDWDDIMDKRSKDKTKP